MLTLQMSPLSSADTEPACLGATEGASPHSRHRSLQVARRPFPTVDPVAWERLAAGPWSTPFGRWPFHRAWWEAYGRNAHDQTLVVVDPAAPHEPVAIAPLMHRHEVEPTDAETRTTMRHGSGVELTPVEPTAKAVFFGASYHADYATLLAAPGDLPEVAEAIVAHLAEDPSADSEHPLPWDVIDLRRLRYGDPAADALIAAFRHRADEHGWEVTVEREDVCPVATLPDTGSIDDHLATLGKKTRHEIRRKVRRAQSAGEVALTLSTDPLADLDAFIDLHQRRWGEEGLFPDTEGGRQSRLFIRRLFECFGPDGPLKLTFLTVGGRRIGSGVHFETADTLYYYNAGVDPGARELSPGVLMVHELVGRALGLGIRRFDFLRGDEPYKYEWGAKDEPIQRVLVRRTRA